MLIIGRTYMQTSTRALYSRTNVSLLLIRIQHKYHHNNHTPFYTYIGLASAASVPFVPWLRHVHLINQYNAHNNIIHNLIH